MNLPDLTMVALVATMLGLVSAAAARRSLRFGLAVAGGLSLWLLFTAALARSGALAAWDARPPRLPLVPLSAFGAFLALNQTGAARALFAATPRHLVLGVQVFRVPVELVLYGLFAAGRAPVQITFEGRNFDILVGLTAPLAAWLARSGRGSPRLLAGWNLLGLGVLANTIFTVVTSTPGPQHLAWPGEPFTAIAAWPMVWLPAFLAPLAIALHVVSLQQHLRLLRGAPASGPDGR
jgi:hypothetical protein